MKKHENVFNRMCQMISSSPFVLYLITEQIFKNLRKMASDFRQIYRVWMGNIAAINLLIPEDIEVNANHTTYLSFYSTSRFLDSYWSIRKHAKK